MLAAAVCGDASKFTQHGFNLYQKKSVFMNGGYIWVDTIYVEYDTHLPGLVVLRNARNGDHPSINSFNAQGNIHVHVFTVGSGGSSNLIESAVALTGNGGALD
jgi:hypothetical protein